MRVLILGATGRTGTLTVSAALAHGHTVTALVRNPSKASFAPSVTLVKGSPLSQSDIQSAFASAPSNNPVTAVIVTLSTQLASGNPFSALAGQRFFMRDSVSNVIGVMKEQPQEVKLVVMSAFGAGSSWKQLIWPFKLLFSYSSMKYQFEDHDAVDELVRKTEGLELVAFRPPMLKEGEAKAVREFGEVGKGIGALDGITRASVAESLVKAAESEKWRNEAVVIAN